jgi:tRNA nucleotidyltransferase/poly(A) polymerase
MDRLAIEILRILNQHGDSCVVGGCVRDHLLGLESNDIDIATNVPMKKIAELFETFDIGKNKDFGVVVVKYKGETFEIAQFRKDSSYSDGRHPDKIEIADSFKEDCLRRDFTINALGLDSDENIIDHVGGTEDILNRVIRCVGDPFERFQEDYLRMLRAVRFASKFSFEIEDGAREAIKQNAHKIIEISQERITQELIKMASCSGYTFANSIKLMDEVGLLKHILPDIFRMKAFPHNPKHHPEGGVFEHTLSALRVNKEKNSLLNLAILFHDVGKPETYKNRDGKHTYYNHDYVGYKMIQEIFKNMKIDNKTIDVVSFCAREHMKLHLFNKMRKSKVIKLIIDDRWPILKKVGYADCFSRGVGFGEKDWPLLENKLTELDVDQYSIMKKKINGDLIMKTKGIKSSPLVGEILKKTFDWVVDNKIDIETQWDLVINYIKGR